MVRLHAAAAIFPLDYDIRRLPIEMAVQNEKLLNPVLVLAEIEWGLSRDPWAADLLHDRDELRKRIKAASP